jgi:hypothetical protein
MMSLGLSHRQSHYRHEARIYKMGNSFVYNVLTCQLYFAPLVGHDNCIQVARLRAGRPGSSPGSAGFISQPKYPDRLSR